MKTIIAMIVAASLLAGCGHPADFTVDGKMKTYPTYGLFNKATSKSKDVCYDVSVGNVVWSVILVETIVMPVYFIGFSIYNPIKAKTPAGCGV